MVVKTIVDEDFVNYKKPSMFIGCPSCSFKCDKLAGKPVCQNGALASAPNVEISDVALVHRFLENPITSAVVLGGLEPFDDAAQMVRFIALLRATECNHHRPVSDVVIYSGYSEDELKTQFAQELSWLAGMGRVFVKVGRYIPQQQSHFDSVLGVNLSSDNQYAIELKE